MQDTLPAQQLFGLIVGDAAKYSDVFTHYPRLHTATDHFSFARWSVLTWTFIDVKTSPSSRSCYDCSLYDLAQNPNFQGHFHMISVDPDCHYDDLQRTLDSVKKIRTAQGIVFFPVPPLPAELTEIATHLDCHRIPAKYIVEALPNNNRFSVGCFWITRQEQEELCGEYRQRKSCCGFIRRNEDTGYVKEFIQKTTAGYETWFLERIKDAFPERRVILERRATPGIVDERGCYPECVRVRVSTNF